MEPLPENFALYTEWPEYLEDYLSPPWMKTCWVGKHPSGLRRSFGAWGFESYTTHIEPSVSPRETRTFIMWRCLHAHKVSEGWWKSRFIDAVLSPRAQYSQAIVRLTGNESDFKQWPRHQRNQWRRGLANGKFSVDSVTLNDFWSAYQTSISWEKVPRYERDIILRKLSEMVNRGYMLRFRIAREESTGAILAGIATLDSREHDSSFYYVSFLCQAGRKHRAVMGLLHDWYLYATEQNYTTLQLGKVWTTPERRGYSDFKRQFATHYIEFSRTLYRYVPRPSL